MNDQQIDDAVRECVVLWYSGIGPEVTIRDRALLADRISALVRRVRAAEQERCAVESLAQKIYTLHGMHDRLSSCMLGSCDACDELEALGAPHHPLNDGYRAESEPGDGSESAWMEYARTQAAAIRAPRPEREA